MKGPFSKDVRLTPGEGGLLNPDVQLLFECDSIVLSGLRGQGSRNPGFSRTSFVNGPLVSFLGLDYLRGLTPWGRLRYDTRIKTFL